MADEVWIAVVMWAFVAAESVLFGGVGGEGEEEELEEKGLRPPKDMVGSMGRWDGKRVVVVGLAIGREARRGGFEVVVAWEKGWFDLGDGSG